MDKFFITFWVYLVGSYATAGLLSLGLTLFTGSGWREFVGAALFLGTIFFAVAMRDFNSRFKLPWN